MLRLYGLRLLVALLTFGVGVAAASLLGFGHSKPPCGKRVLTYEAVSLGEVMRETPPPAPRSCSFKVSGGILNGKAVSLPQPALPPIAKSARALGPVVVEVLVDEDGNVISAKGVSGHPLLQQAAVEAARQAKFSPTRLSGRPVQVSGLVTYNFALE
ncbi:MAG TPA: TonB family protein [Pyrinomonadaceae bacterium]|nr:TonB family protein [Pyrinomonadaceae bacterium]